MFTFNLPAGYIDKDANSPYQVFDHHLSRGDAPVGRPKKSDRYGNLSAGIYDDLKWGGWDSNPHALASGGF